MEPPREAPTMAEIIAFAEQLPADEAKTLLSRVHPAPLTPSADSMTAPAEEPLYTSWEDYLAQTTVAERMTWCRGKAKRANRKRLMSDEPDVKLRGEDVWAVLEMAQGDVSSAGRWQWKTDLRLPPVRQHLGRTLGDG